jgi:hypothetical protein
MNRHPDHSNNRYSFFFQPLKPQEPTLSKDRQADFNPFNRHQPAPGVVLPFRKKTNEPRPKPGVAALKQEEKRLPNIEPSKKTGSMLTVGCETCGAPGHTPADCPSSLGNKPPKR